MIYRRVQKREKATNYCVRFGHSLWSTNQLPAQGVKAGTRNTSSKEASVVEHLAERVADIFQVDKGSRLTLKVRPHVETCMHRLLDFVLQRVVRSSTSEGTRIFGKLNYR